MENTFDELLDCVSQEHKEFVSQVNGIFMNAGFKVQVESKASGYFASYKDPKTKKSVFNFFFRKNGLHVRIYANYNENLIDLTDDMAAKIEKAIDCKILNNTGECSPHCARGYEFDLKGIHYQKCRHKAFEFSVTQQNNPIIVKWINTEIIAKGEEHE